MLKNYLLIAYRNSIKNKLHAGINIAGLSIGLAFVVLIFLFVQHEWSYDTFHANAENIYRVNEVEYRMPGMTDETSLFQPEQENLNKYAYLPLATGPVLANDFEGLVEKSCRVAPSQALVNYRERSFMEDQFYLADANFLDMFSLELAISSTREAFC